MSAPTGELRLRSIAELLGEDFYVPSYQRGYRWTAQQVVALLDDLEAFLRSDAKRDEYYCLQPIVVCPGPDGAWELVDGQQRLTTISLLIGALGNVAKMLGKESFGLRYATREGSETFLRNPIEEGSTEYIDFHHMFQARQAIERWFADRDGTTRLKLLSCLTGPDGEGANVRIIWYELSEQQKPREVFIRLNVGRIPLSSAELIRALFLRADSQTGARDRRDRIAQEWDLIEKQLHEPSYWYFLQSSPSPPPARIEYLFDIFVRAVEPELAVHPDPLATFYAFQRWMEAQDGDRYDKWLVFRRETAQVLEEWFEDRVFFHLVGLLVAIAPRGLGPAGTLVDLLAARRGKTATELGRHLRELAWRRFLGGKNPPLPATAEDLEAKLAQRLGDLRYGESGEALRGALLLFNVAGLVQSPASSARFRFDGYKENDWDIEHVRSVTEYVPQSPVGRRRWLEHARGFVSSPAARVAGPKGVDGLVGEITELLAQGSPDRDRFQDVFAAVRELSGEEVARESDDALSNLVLLDMSTNRSYQNAVFPVKRQRVIDLDREGQYVPPGTRNVFLKYYSPNATQLLLWDQEDEGAYGRAQHETLLDFFRPLVGGDA